MTAITTSRPAHRRQKPARHGAALYVMVMGLTLIVSAIGLSAIMVARAQLRMNMADQAVQETRRLASSAVENALVVLHTNPNWRTDYLNNVEYPTTPVPLGDGSFTWKLVDKDGSLSDNDADTVRVYGIGRLGQQVATESVRFQPSGSPLTCLEVSAHANNDVTFNSAQVTGNQVISANNSITASSSNIAPAVQAVNSVSGGSFNGGSTSGITPRSMPDPNTVFDYYITNGTPIDVNSLPTWGGAADIKGVVLSPAVNPYGSGETNPEGIYVIDLAGQNLYIRECRIVGTLVLLNAGSICCIYQKEVFWEPAVSNYPALLVDGNFTFQFSSYDPLEESIYHVNFNPPGTPYDGVEDTDQVDIYPCVIRGLVYVSGDAFCNWDHPAFEGVLVVGNTLTVSEPLDLQYDSTFLNNPPPGFRSGDQMEVLRGSWRPGPGS